MTRPDEDQDSVDQSPITRRTGAMLAEARAAAGLELTEIAKETRVPVRHLIAIENDQHDALPALPYAIGFVKSFARSVGLDPETVAAQFRAETSKVAHVPSVVTLEPVDERRVPSRGLVMASVAAVLVIIGGLAAWGSGLFDAPPVGESQLAAASVTAPAPAADVSATTVDAASPAATGVEAPVVPVATPPAAGVPVSAPAAAVPGGSVVLTAKEDVWIKVYSRETRTSAKIGILKAGESFTVPADPPGLLLWTGKAGALSITAGGKPVASLGGPVETVKDVSLAPADLLARPAPPAAAPGA